MAPSPVRARTRDDFEIAIICALPLEADLVDRIFDKHWEDDGIDLGKASGDQNAYTIGVIGKHNVVLAHMPCIGGNSAASVSAGLRASFTQIEINFVVGICGASPVHPETGEEVILGDCIISTTVVQYDFGQQYATRFIRKKTMEDSLALANPTIRSWVNKLQTSRNLDNLSKRLLHHLDILQSSRIGSKVEYPGTKADCLFEASYLHIHRGTTEICEDCSLETGSCVKGCELLGCSETIPRTRLTEQAIEAGENKPRVRFGRVGSANTVLKSSSHRDQLTIEDKIAVYEMEGAGAWHNLPTILVKSASDYADSHKNEKWQSYAAATAAAALKAILECWPSAVNTTIPIQVAFNVPDRMVANFVQRTDILEKANGWLLDDVRMDRLILRGMGGAGKTQLALACCRKAVTGGHFSTVLWFDASSVFSIEQSFKIVLSELGEFQAVSEPRENLAILTKALQYRKGPWLAVFDNFDTPSLFCQNLITDYIPKVEHGKILFTSRHTASERLGHTIAVSKMTDNESLELLLRRPAHDSFEQVAVLRIAADLGHLALALDQAQAYIRARHLSLQEFPSHFRTRKKKILQEVPRHWEYKKNRPGSEQYMILSAFTTWELSCEQLSGSKQVRRNKEHFLTLCAFFDSSSISKDYFQSYCESTKKEWTKILKSGKHWNGFLFDDLVAECGNLSLLQTEDQHGYQQGSISLHPLIRDWLKLRKTSKQRDEAAQEFTCMLVSHIKATNFETLGQMKREDILVNVMACLQGNKRLRYKTLHNELGLVGSARVFGDIFLSSGCYSEAEQLYMAVLASRKEQLGIDHPRTLWTKHRLATIYRFDGRYDEAEKLYMQVLTCKQEQLRPKHPEILRVMESLAIVYQNKAKYAEAEAFYNQALSGRSEELGAGHPDTLGTMQDLATLYEVTGKYDEAEELLQKALAGRQEQYGAKHPYTLRTMHNLAGVYRNKRLYDEAEELYKQALVGRQEQLGPNHPYTLHTMQKLAILYNHQGRHNEAEELCIDILASNQTRLGSSHPYILGALESLAIVHRSKGHYDEAEELLKEALTGREARLGSKHPYTVRTAQNLDSLRKQRVSS